MHAVVIEHVRIADLPEAWRTRLPASPDTRVTIRIEEESVATTDALTEDPMFGMWRDREDMADVDAYVRKLRTPRVNLHNTDDKG
jgi:hypothetical protein